MQRLAPPAIARTVHPPERITHGVFIWGSDNVSMQPSTHAFPITPPPVLNAPRPVSPARLRAILEIEFHTIRSASHPQCTISEPRWRKPAAPLDPNWTIDPPQPCPDGCHEVINRVAADLALRYQLERRARRRG